MTFLSCTVQYKYKIKSVTLLNLTFDKLFCREALSYSEKTNRILALDVWKSRVFLLMACTLKVITHLCCDYVSPTLMFGVLLKSCLERPCMLVSLSVGIRHTCNSKSKQKTEWAFWDISVTNLSIGLMDFWTSNLRNTTPVVSHFLPVRVRMPGIVQYLACCVTESHGFLLRSYNIKGKNEDTNKKVVTFF